MTRWTHEQVTKLAPDAAALAAARRLAVPSPWSDTGASETLVWGRCQGSGKTPYQVSVDITGPAFRCSCPSRKFPCKHALALMLLWVDGQGTVPTSADAAAFAGEWAARRAATAAAEAATPARKAPDPAARAKRLEERLALMDGGVADFRLWLTDLVRGGTAAARQQPYPWWDAAAARLVDVQLPGLAEQVRTLASEVRARDDWAEHMLVVLGRWWAIAHAWAGRDALSEHELGDLRAVLGWSYPSDAVLAADAVTDSWLVLGAHRSDDGRLQQQRTWLWGETTHQTLQVLDFAAGGQALPVAQVVGSVLQATVARYPGTTARRARFVDQPAAVRDAGGLPAGGDLDDAFRVAAEAWALNAWATRVPVVLDGVRLAAERLVDGAGRSVPLLPEARPWLALAVSGGAPVTVFAELEERGARLLSVEVEGQLVAL
ncbi:SWIM zinc finger family protein [Nocardioides nanhaiensis]|uniref:SWIM zinc finger family protein n=1 Tax=Nocardioides nanhaiensis TaxID=1476871 RepID=A0ABP8W360_9ACTN